MSSDVYGEKWAYMACIQKDVVPSLEPWGLTLLSPEHRSGREPVLLRALACTMSQLVPDSQGKELGWIQQIFSFPGGRASEVCAWAAGEATESQDSLERVEKTSETVEAV